MNKLKENIFINIIRLLTLFTISIIVFLFYFMIKEALPLFKECSVKDFIFGTEWMPVSFGNKMSCGVWYFVLGTVYVSVLAILFSTLISIGVSLIIVFKFNEKLRTICFAIINMISGIPSVVFGFFGLQVLSPIFFKMGVKTGNCVLLASIVLAIMLLPFIINSLCFTFMKNKQKYFYDAKNLGIDEWYIVVTIILPASLKGIILSSIVANCRAMGETMAVMMLIGNAKVFPHLLSKGETIASLIALEMGTAIKNSIHYNALYAAGLLLLVLTFVINNMVRMLGKLK